MQPACFLQFEHFFCVRGNDITAPTPATRTLKTDEFQTSFRWVLTPSCTQLGRCCKNRNSEAKQGRKTSAGTATVKYVWTQRDSARLCLSKRGCCFFLQPFDEWWVAAGSIRSHYIWNVFTALYREFCHVICMHIVIIWKLLFFISTTRCWVRLVPYSWCCL